MEVLAYFLLACNVLVSMDAVLLFCQILLAFHLRHNLLRQLESFSVACCMKFSESQMTGGVGVLASWQLTVRNGRKPNDDYNLQFCKITFAFE